MRQLKNLGKARCRVCWASESRGRGGVVRSTFSHQEKLPQRPQAPQSRTTMVSEREEHFGDPGRVKRQAAPGHTASWTVRLFTEKSKATRAGQSEAAAAGITGLVSQGDSADARGGLRAPGLRAGLRVACEPSHTTTPSRLEGTPPQGPSFSRGVSLRKSAQNHDCWGP